MAIEIKLNRKPDFKKIQFLCDTPIHEKLNEYELTRDFFNKQNTTLIVGLQGSGKTNLLINFIKKVYRKVFHHIYVWMRETSRNSLSENIFDKNLDPSHIYEDLTVESINEVYDQLKANSKNEEWSLLIMDDVQDSLKDIEVVKVLKKIIANQRHLRAVVIIVLQNYFALDNKIRKLIHNFIMFKMDKKQNQQIFEELYEGDKSHFDRIREMSFQEPHDWLFINPRSGRIFKQWDELIIH